MNSQYRDLIKERYESAKKLAEDTHLVSDSEDHNNSFYYFECGFIQGMNYRIYQDYLNENETK